MDEAVDYRKEILIWLTSDATRLPIKNFNVRHLVAKEYKLPKGEVEAEMQKMLSAGLFDFTDLKRFLAGEIREYTIVGITEKGSEYLTSTKGGSHE